MEKPKNIIKINPTCEYPCQWDDKGEDKIIAYAGRLIRPLKKYGNPEEGYDFSKARTARQRAEVIGIWIGEILYEALTYKDVEAVKSLTETIKTEIEELISERT